MLSQQILKEKLSWSPKHSWTWRRMFLKVVVRNSGVTKCSRVCHPIILYALFTYTPLIRWPHTNPIDLIPGLKSFGFLWQVLIYLLVFKKLLWFRKWTNSSHSCSASVYKQRRTFPPFPATTSFLTNTSRTYKFSKIHAWKLL